MHVEASTKSIRKWILSFTKKWEKTEVYLKNNQEAHGPHCSTEKHFQTIKKPEESYDCTRRLVKSHYYFSMAPLFEQTGIPFTEGCILPSEVEINQMVLN